MDRYYAVVFEPFENGLEYVKEADKAWTVESPLKTFTTRALAQVEADKWNTGEVVELSEFDALNFNEALQKRKHNEEHEPDFIME